MKYDQPHVSIIILNWNGWGDTIECLESVFKSDYERYHIILVDNHSDDNSIEKIRQWALYGNDNPIETNFPNLVFPPIPKPISYFDLRIEDKLGMDKSIQNYLPEEIPVQSLILIQNYRNAGFSAGNNLGIKIAENLFKSNYIFLLNNDTVIDPDTISQLVSHLDQHPEIGVATSAIYYYENPQEIHNLGGKLTWRATCKYFTTIPNYALHRLTFVTGCSLLIRTSIFEKVGMLSEKFFFGEEDFEFSWRLRKKKVPVACVLESKVFHKVSISSDSLYKKESLRRKFVYVFGRIIDMKDHMRYPVWLIWKWIVMGYSFFWLTIKYRVKVNDALLFIRYIYKYSRLFNDARKPTIDNILEEISL